MQALRALTLGMAFCVSAASAGCASAEPDTTSSDEAAITGGKADLRWPAAGYLVTSAAKTTIKCGATLIAPRVVVTAAHCVLPAKNAPAGSPEPALEFGVGNPGGRTVKILERRVHPDFSRADALLRHDIATLVLERALTDVTPAQLPTARETDGKRLVSIGYHAEGGVVVRKSARSVITTSLNLGSDPIFEVGFGFRQGGLCNRDGDEGSAAMIPNASGGDSPQVLAGIYVGSVTAAFTDCKEADGWHDQLLDGHESAFGYRAFLEEGIARGKSLGPGTE